MFSKCLYIEHNLIIKFRRRLIFVMILYIKAGSSVGFLINFETQLYKKVGKRSSRKKGLNVYPVR